MIFEQQQIKDLPFGGSNIKKSLSFKIIYSQVIEYTWHALKKRYILLQNFILIAVYTVNQSGQN